jgi:hypothetical protein
VLLGCYTQTLAFLGEIGALANVGAQPHLSVTMIDRAGRRSRLVCPPLPAPLHLLAGAMEWDALDWSDRLSLLRMATPLKLARDPGRLAASPGETVESWLVRHGQTERLREMLWRPPARAFIQARGGEVRTGAIATIRLAGQRVAGVEADSERWEPRAVIAAVPWFACEALFDDPLHALAGIVDRASRMSSSPIVTVNLWFDRPVLDEPFVGLPGRVMQWVFDKPTVLGDAASRLSLVSSGADEIVRLANDQVTALAHAELLAALPVARRARLLRSSVVRERQATFSLAPGQPARPATNTPVNGLFLAGDWIDTGLPATIESAVRSGHHAADAAIREFGHLVI